jgi:hypothetical protein
VYVYQYSARQTDCSVFYFGFVGLPFASHVVKIFSVFRECSIKRHH